MQEQVWVDRCPRRGSGDAHPPVAMWLGGWHPRIVSACYPLHADGVELGACSTACARPGDLSLQHCAAQLVAECWMNKSIPGSFKHPILHVVNSSRAVHVQSAHTSISVAIACCVVGGGAAPHPPNAVLVSVLLAVSCSMTSKDWSTAPAGEIPN